MTSGDRIRLAGLISAPVTSGSCSASARSSISYCESEKARPRAEQIAKLVALSSVGKREAAAMLEQLNGAKR
jgi:hypothetical protein